MAQNFRVRAYGDTSYFRDSKEKAYATATQVMQGNGCGCIEQRQPNGCWKMISRFEPWYGIVAV